MDHTAAAASPATYPQATSSNAQAVAVGETSSEPVQAYAKLEGDSFCYYIRTLQVTFGRKASSSDHVDIHLGPTKAISRQHARLFYNFTTQRFEMMVFGKNGAFVNDQFVEKGVTVPLENRTKIQIGEVSFSFLLPKIETDDGSQDGLSQGSMQRNGTAADKSENVASTTPSVKREASSQSIENFDSSEYSSKDTKPPFSYASLIAQAINSTSERKLTLNGIYQYITQHYPYYQMAHNGWQNSIRHNLSLNKAFVKVPRADSEPGKGAFWTIDQSCESQFANGVYKRNRRAISTKPAEGRSESPMDGEKPRKRINVGLDSTASSLSQSSQSSTLASTQSSATPPQQDLSQISEASLKLAALLQQNPGVLALNLATLTQSLSAADKETAQNAILSALVTAARVNSAKAGQASATTPASTSTPQAGTSSPGTGSTQQSLATLQAVAAAIAAARSTATTSSPPVATSSPLTASAASSPALSVTGSAGLGATLPTVSSTALPSNSAAASPIAQLVAAAQAQAAVQARMLAQAQAQTQASASTPSALTSIPASSSESKEEDAQAQVLALQARALALAQAQQAQEAQEALKAQEANASSSLSVATETTDSTPPSHSSDTSVSADSKETTTVETNA